MLGVVDDVRITAGDGYAAWSESFNEMFMQKGALTPVGSASPCQGRMPRQPS